MANRNSSFGEGQSGAKGAESGIIKPAVERPALSGGQSTVKAQPTFAKPKVVEQDGRNVFDDGTVVSELELARTKKQASEKGVDLSGGSYTPAVQPSRPPTWSSERDATSKEVLNRTNQHLKTLQTHASTTEATQRHSFAKLPQAFNNHTTAVKHLALASFALKNAQEAFSMENSSKGNGHLKEATGALVTAHKNMSSKAYREAAGSEVPLHKDDLHFWDKQSSSLTSFREQGKPFEFIQIGGEKTKDGKKTEGVKVRPGSREAKRVAEGAKGTIVEDKLRAGAGTPRVAPWNIDKPARPTRGEKGTGVIDTKTTGAPFESTGESDPRRKGSTSKGIDTKLRKANLPKIGDTVKKANPAMKPGDTVKGK
jgi:hypothetical protein